MSERRRPCTADQGVWGCTPDKCPRDADENCMILDPPTPTERKLSALGEFEKWVMSEEPWLSLPMDNGPPIEGIAVEDILAKLQELGLRKEKKSG